MRWTPVLALVLGCGTSTTKDTDVGVTDADTDTDTDADTDTDTDTDSPHDTGTTVTGDGGFCAVRRVFNQSCLVCHNATSPQGNLDLQTDPWSAIVGVRSVEYGEMLVLPKDPVGSLLWRKMDGSQSASEGSFMPTTGALPAQAAIVEQWIAEGATEECGTPGTTTEPEPYHAEGWEAPAVHGTATKFQTETDCRTCHGSDLLGGSSGVACSDCHAAGWETNCTYCHGGVSSTTGAPPEDLDDNADPATISFVPHGVHEAGRISAVFDCTQCHVNPADALTAGHLFDDLTPGLAEVAPTPGTYEVTTATCSNQYCHGDGRGANGEVVSTDGPRTCHSCHPDATSGAREVLGMSGRHYIHIPAGLQCGECHPSAQGSNQIDQPLLHVNGAPDVALPQTMNFDAARMMCRGACHGEVHDNRSW